MNMETMLISTIKIYCQEKHYSAFWMLLKRRAVEKKQKQNCPVWSIFAKPNCWLLLEGRQWFLLFLPIPQWISRVVPQSLITSAASSKSGHVTSCQSTVQSHHYTGWGYLSAKNHSNTVTQQKGLPKPEKESQERVTSALSPITA